MHRRLLALLVGASTLLLVLGGSANAVTYGEKDDNAHPYVVLLTFYYDVDGNGIDTAPVATPDGFTYPVDYQWRCTGTIIDPTTVLTAGHCTAGVPYGTDGLPMTETGSVPMELAHVYIGYDSTTVHPALATTGFVTGNATPTPVLRRLVGDLPTDLRRWGRRTRHAA